MIALAKFKDTEYIHKEILLGAEEGHFDRRLLEPEHSKRLLVELRHIIANQRRTNGKLAKIYIHKNWFKPEGYAVISEARNPKQLEVWMMGVSANKRGKGIGRKLFSTVLAKERSPEIEFIVRCAPESETMIHLAESIGFTFTLTNDEGFREYRLRPNPSLNSDPTCTT